MSVVLAVVWAWMAFALARAMRAAQEAGLIGRRLRLVGRWAALISSFACIAATVVFVLHPLVFNEWTNAAPTVFSASSIVLLTCWTATQWLASRRIRRSPLQELTWIQAVLIALLWAVYLIVMSREAVLKWQVAAPVWLENLVDRLEYPMIALIAALLILMMTNLVLMRRSVRRFVRARTGAL
ncbi:MAG: hypothetical protein K2Q09_08130 [Phycisphaerales bacterium]|nr:hypothetical protein [Phycisphaerales bacterium]